MSYFGEEPSVGKYSKLNIASKFGSFARVNFRDLLI
jgi:hypothetical protein